MQEGIMFKFVNRVVIDGVFVLYYIYRLELINN